MKGEPSNKHQGAPTAAGEDLASSTSIQPQVVK